ncbi:MAG: peptidoglycan bridge formation glycyltransferase FemA/FemB family protein [Chloroflexia bacterium]|nr:peptidoglycan bridge formation glycyltransferase FemA/FemB family protein [Chloroflexia bacterium]
MLVNDPAGTAMAQVLYRFQGPVSIGYVPRGPAFAGDIPVLWPLLLKEIDASARRNRAIATILELDRATGFAGSLRDAGLVPGPEHLQPGRTVKIPIADDDVMLRQMHQKTRYNVRLAQRRGVVIERHHSDEPVIDAFYDLMQDTAVRNEFGIHSREYYADFLRLFAEDAIMLFARVDEGALGAVLIAARFGKEAIYMYGASSTKHRAHGAAFLLQFEAMRWAREHGCENYDLWGISDKDPETVKSDTTSAIAGTKGDDWRGLYRFKTGFGGQIVTYPALLERRHVPVLPWLARKLNVIKG